MKALAYHGPGVRSCEEKPMPIIKASTDAIVRITKATVMTSMLLKTVVSGKLHARQLITHHFTLDEAMQAYDTFDGAMKEEALKAIITNDIMRDKALAASGVAGIAILDEQLLKGELIVNDSLADKNEK